MSVALVGSTGLVGGHLLSQVVPDACFHSANIASIRGRRFDLLLCAGAPATKWVANQNPAADLANLRMLMDQLEHVRARRAVLFSTVDVFEVPVAVDENSSVPRSSQAYGLHRRMLERFLEERFDTLVVRLPGLFGVGLKKNVVYDLLHAHRLEAIDPRSTFQYYDLRELWADVQRAQRFGVGRVLHLATEPFPTARLAEEVFGRALSVPNPQALPQRYDLRSIYGAAWGQAGPYLYRAEEIIARLKWFVAAQRSCP